jgi:hypothetical protein
VLGHRDHDGPVLGFDRRDDSGKQPFAGAEVVQQPAEAVDGPAAMI